MTDDARSDLKILETADDPVERNAAALRLAERRTPEAKAVLLMLIGRKDLRDQRGALVHALGYFDCSDQFGLLVDLVINGNFEVAQEALEILELVDAVAEEAAEAGFAAVEEALDEAELEDWRRDLLNELQEMFD